MRRSSSTYKRLVLNGFLLISLIALLLAYAAIVADLPAQMLTPAQHAFLSYNRGRLIIQDAPLWNALLPGDQIQPAPLSAWGTRVRATLDARYEEKGGISATVYDLDFTSEYQVAYPDTAVTTTVELYFPFPSNLETLHDVRLLVDGTEPPGVTYTLDGIRWSTEVAAGDEYEILVGYKADGATSFAYTLNHDRRSEVLDVTITVRGLDGSQVSAGALPPTGHKTGEANDTFVWEYVNLVPSRDIRLELPTRLGFAQRVAQLQGDFRALARLAPALVGLFLASLAGLLRLADIRIRLTSLLLVGTGLALFYPSLTLLSGLVEVFLAAPIAFLVISGLVLVFLGLSIGWKATWWRVALLLLDFLGIFSMGLLTPWRGLLLTGGAILLVGTFMLHYAHYARSKAPQAPAMTSTEDMADAPSANAFVADVFVADAPIADDLVAGEPTDDELAAGEPAAHPPDNRVEKTIHEQAPRHCPRCGRALGDDHVFCPGCGFDVHPLWRCDNCGHEQFSLAELDLTHCVHCGEPLTPRLD